MCFLSSLFCSSSGGDGGWWFFQYYSTAVCTTININTTPRTKYEEVKEA